MEHEHGWSVLHLDLIHMFQHSVVVDLELDPVRSGEAGNRGFVDEGLGRREGKMTAAFTVPIVNARPLSLSICGNGNHHAGHDKGFLHGSFLLSSFSNE